MILSTLPPFFLRVLSGRALGALVLLLGICLALVALGAATQAPIDPAAWGADHVGQPVPDYVHGDECLFCHRYNIGATWQQNAHGLTLRQREDAPALTTILEQQPALTPVGHDVEFFLGSRHRMRFLKKAGYGRLALLNTQAVIDRGRAVRWIDVEQPAWDANRFADRCAGCHATGVDAKTRAFSAFGLDCYTCHGDVTLDHTKDTSLIWWSAKRRALTGIEPARAMISICAQCHLRGGRSRSTGLPYPNTFVAGDNLFRDFEVDFAKSDDASVNPGDRHIYRVVRDVVVNGSSALTCYSCHRLHVSSTARHRLIPRSAVCLDCHDTGGDKLGTKPYTVQSAVCEY